MRYTNFDLWIDAGVDGRYPVRAASPLGEVRGSVSLDPRREFLQQIQQRLDQRQIDQADLIAFGRQLYQLLFTGDVERLFERSAGQSWNHRSEQGIRIRLRIEAPELIVLPWEFLYCPRRERFLGTSIQCPVVRYLEIFEPIDHLEAMLPLRMLVAIPDSAELDAAREKSNLIRTLEGLEQQVQIAILEGTVTLNRLSDALLEQPFHGFHFIGHGGFEHDRAFLQLNSEQGDAEWIADDRLVSLFANHPTLKLVFLNSCQGAQTSLTAPLAGLAHRLIKQGVPAVVAMQYAVYDDAAVLFSREFYQALFKGQARGRVEFAVSHARNRLLGEFPGERDIGAPVLFMRASEGLLFNVAAGDRLADLPLARGAYHRSEAAKNAYRDNIEKLQQKCQETASPVFKTALEQQTAELSRLERKLGYRRIVVIVAAAASLLIFLFFWIRLFDFLPPAFRIESYAVWLAGAWSSRQSGGSVVVVAITDQTEQALGKPFGRDWRREHALVLDRLTKAGAKVIAFDLYFEEPSAQDREFVSAVEDARRRGATVIAGFRRLDGGTPNLPPSFKRAGVKPGLLCIGKKWGLSQTAPLLVLPQSRPALFSLALEASAAFQGREVVFDRGLQEIDLLDPATRQIVDRAVVSSIEQVKWEQAGCPAIGKQDRVASLIIDPAFVAGFDPAQAKYAYEAIFKASDRTLADRFENKLVLIGVERNDERFPVVHGWTAVERYGVELHAIAIDSLLAKRSIKLLEGWGQFFALMGMGLSGGLLNLAVGRQSRLVRAGGLTGVFLSYCALASYLFQAYLIVLNMLYPLLAFGVSYWMAGKIGKRWF